MDFEKVAAAAARIAYAQAQYVHTLDDGDIGQWPDFFVDDCFYKVTSADNYAQNHTEGLIWLTGKAMLHDRILSLREANVYERHSYRHMVSQPLVTGVEGEEVTSETSFLVARITREGPTMLFATGRYVDQWRIADGKALIARRIVVLDSGHVDTLLGFPL